MPATDTKSSTHTFANSQQVSASMVFPKAEPHDIIDISYSSPPCPLLELHPLKPWKRSQLFITISESSSSDSGLESYNPASVNGTTPQLKTEQPSTDTIKISTTIRIGSVFCSSDEAQKAVFTSQEQLGHRWHIAQSKQAPDGSQRKIIFQCNHYYRHKPVHLQSIDPSNHREGKSIKTDCDAHVNIIRQANGLWNVSVVSWIHNHPPELPLGTSDPLRPTQAQKGFVENFTGGAGTGQFNRTHMDHIL